MKGEGAKEMQRAVGVWHEKLLQGMAAVEFPNAPTTPARLSQRAAAVSAATAGVS